MSAYPGTKFGWVCVGRDNKWVDCKGTVRVHQRTPQSPLVSACDAHKPCPVCGVFNPLRPHHESGLCQYCFSGRGDW